MRPNAARLPLHACFAVSLFLMLALLVSSAEAAEVIRKQNAITGEYIIVAALPSQAEAERAGALSNIEAAVRDHQGRVHGRWSDALVGLHATLTDKQAQQISNLPFVQFVEENATLYGGLAVDQFEPDNWGLLRIAERNLPLDDNYTYNGTGAGVHAYVVDTGIRSTHAEFGSRIGNGQDFVGDNQGNVDCFGASGHGTGVASLIGGQTLGVAKEVVLHSVRVYGCTNATTTATIVNGLNWVAANKILPAVANLRFSEAPSDSIDLL